MQENNDIEEKGIGGVVGTIKEKGGTVLACPGDITDKGQVDLTGGGL